MATPQRRPPGEGIGTGTDVHPPEVPPIDPDEIRQIHLLEEAVLVMFTATPPQLTPFGRSTLAWDITMPTTLLPGINPEVHLVHGVDDEVVLPTGRSVVRPYGETTYGLVLRTPKAHRQMGTLDLAVDFTACKLVETAPGVFGKLGRDQVDAAFPATGKLRLRGGSTIDFGFGSFVVDVPLELPIENWFDVNADVSLGFSVSSANGSVSVTHDVAITKIYFPNPVGGAITAVFTGGCAQAVEAALEAQSDGFLAQFIGPVIARQIRDRLISEVNKNLDRLNNDTPRPPVPYTFYDLTLDADGLVYRYCPEPRPSTGGSGSNGGSDTRPVHPG